jgi:membrane-associated protease RseP (regulator of RpoE activity)
MRSSPRNDPASPGPAESVAPRWRTNLWLFLATIVSVFVTGAAASEGAPLSREALVDGAQFSACLLTILVAHELGHYVAARIHKVDASLPYFIPLPLLSPFGTMGAVIRMRGVIPTRRALLDIGASGPLAGLCFAIPLYVWGIAHSKVIVPPDDAGQLGSSLLIRLIDHLAGPHVPAGMDLQVSPVAFAAWAGMFVTMINLLPVGQLDGGHVAYALFGPRQDKIAKIVHRSMLAFFFVSVASFVFRDVRAGLGLHRIGQHVGNSLFWLVWFEVLAILGSLAARGSEQPPDATAIPVRTRLVATLGLALLAGVGRQHSSPILWIGWFAALGVLLAMEVRGGVLRPHSLVDHPATGAAPLGKVRATIAIVTLLFFVALFMPTPMSM